MLKENITCRNCGSSAIYTLVKHHKFKAKQTCYFDAYWKCEGCGAFYLDNETKHFISHNNADLFGDEPHTIMVSKEVWKNFSELQRSYGKSWNLFIKYLISNFK